MKNFKSLIFVAIIAFTAINIHAQPGVFQPGDYRDGIYDKENSTNRRFIPYTHLREADVSWEKRVWRRLDMREKQNQQLYYPVEPVVSRISFTQLLIKYILTGEIKAFKDEEFLVPLELSSVRKSIVLQEDSADVEEFDKDGNAFMVKKPGLTDSTWIFENFTSLELKEDWFFDKQKSVLEAANPLRSKGVKSIFFHGAPSFLVELLKLSVFNLLCKLYNFS